MSEITKNIKKLRCENGLTLLEVANYLGVKEATVQRYESGKIKHIKYETICKLAELYHCDPSSIMGWDEEQAISRAFNVVPVGRQGMRPIYGSISAGLGEFVEGDNNILGWEPVEEKFATDEYFYLRVKGDSMSPKIEDGDLLLIRKQASVDSGDIGAFLVDGEEGYVKRVKYDTNYVTFISLNPAYEPITFLGKDVKRVLVIGKVIKIVKNLGF